MLIQKNANIGVNLYKPPAAPKTPEELSEEEAIKKKEKPEWQWKPLRKDKNEETKVTPLFQVQFSHTFSSIYLWE